MRTFREIGWRVGAVCSPDQFSETFASHGVEFNPIPFRRSGFAPWGDLSCYWRLKRLYRKYQPCLIHHFNGKPVILGSLASACVHGGIVVNTITGLGHAFAPDVRMLPFQARIYKRALGLGKATIFQNPENRDFFFAKGWADPETSRLIESSGVDTLRFKPRDKPVEGTSPMILLVARMIWDKGIKEFVEAAEICHERFPNARFQILGEWDPGHLQAVPKEWIEEKKRTGAIEFLGFRENIETVISEADLVALPSSSREGLPRVLLEAGSCGVPVIASDVAGCRSGILDGKTGVLVPPGDSRGLARAISDLLDNPVKRKRMGMAGRKWMETNFDIRKIALEYFDVYREAGVSLPAAIPLP